MGQSTVIASAFSMIMFVGGLYIVFAATTSSFETLEIAISQQTDAFVTYKAEDIQVTGYKRDNATDLRLNITNTGETSLRFRELDKLDIIPTYNVTGAVSTDYVGYDQSGQSTSFWRVNRVFYKGSLGELVNPIDIQQRHGLWDPDESIEVRIHVDGSLGFERVTIATANGVTVSHPLTLEEQGGSVVMPSGETTVWVGHELGRVPVSISVISTDDSDRYWITQWNSTHFEIFMRKDRGFDILFFWYIR